MAQAGATIESNHFGRTLALVLVVLASLFTATAYINKLSHQEHRDISARHYQRGEELVQAGKVGLAVEEYQAAVTMNRDNLVYQQALARALFREGSLAEARSYVRPLLEHDPIDGQTNLLMARILGQEQKLPAQRGFQPPTLDQVEDYYRRAVYGQWASESSARRLAARFELIDLLRGSGRRNQAIAELAALADDTPGDPETQIRVANLLYDTGAAEQSAGIYNALLKQRPRDSDLYAALGRAEFERGNYKGARDAYRDAIRWKPDNPAVRKRLEVMNDIISLDPTKPLLSQAERMKRTERLLRRATALADECATSNPQAAGALAPSLQSAADYLDPRKRSHNTESETGLGITRQIWTEARNACSGLEKRDEAMTKVLALVENR